MQREQVWISPSNPQSARGTALQFALSSLSPNGHLRDLTQQARWRVSAEGGAMLPVPADRTLELAEPGRYRVTAEYGDRQLETLFTVTAATLTSVAISPSAPLVAKGLSQPFVATAHFSDGTTQDVTRLAAWSAKDVVGTAVAVINTLGVAKAQNVGTARVSVRYKTKSTSTTMQVTAATLVTLSISPSNPTIALGTAQPFTATGTFSDGSVQDVTAAATWAVADLMGSGVAQIDSSGVATGEAVGKATISATYGGQVVETPLTVTAATAVSLAVSPPTATVAKGTNQTFVATATLTDGSTKVVTTVSAWTTRDVIGIGVASVDSTGLAKGNAVGTATIACNYLGLVASATLQVTPATLTALTVNPATATIAKGLNQAFTVVGGYSDGSQQNLTTLAAWTTADVVGTAVASVSATGLAVGNNVGKATVSASYLGKSASGRLTVSAATLSSLALSPGSPVVKMGTTQQFKATGTFSDGSNQDVSNVASWTATDFPPASGVASISSSGLATANKAGKSTIAAQYLGQTASAVLTVPDNRDMCSTDSWCWRNPLPTQQWLYGAWGTNANNVWAVGDQGTILKWNGAAWTVQTTGTPQSYDAVWGSDANNIWVVGWGGAILKWNGTSWATQASGTTGRIAGVWGTDANNVWAVGSDGILKWDGTSWTPQPTGFSPDLSGVWGTDANNIWAVGGGGIILKWDGISWTLQPSGNRQDLTSVWGSDVKNVWAVGYNGTILQWNGTLWAPQLLPVSQPFTSVWGTDANNVWAVGLEGTIARWDGTKWTILSGTTVQGFQCVWGTDASNVWVVGDEGAIVKWNGTALLGQAATERLTGTWGSAANQIWAVGWDGAILKWSRASSRNC